MELWQSLLVAFGGNAALLLVLSFFARSLMVKVLERDTERFKAELQIAAVEHQVRFSKLHERRAEIFARLYELLVEATWETSRFTSLMQWEGDPDKKEQSRTTMNAIAAYFRFLDQNRIWLPSDICEPLEQFAKALRKPAIELDTYLSIENPTARTLEELRNAWTEAWELVENDIPTLRKAIEEQFRSILGANEQDQPG